MKRTRRISLIIALLVISFNSVFINSASIFAAEDLQYSEENQVEIEEDSQVEVEKRLEQNNQNQEVLAEPKSEIEVTPEVIEYEQEVEIEESSVGIYISAIHTANGEKYIELFNSTTQNIPLSEITLTYFSSGASSKQIILEDGIFQAGSYILLAQDSGFLAEFDQILQTDPASSALIGKSSGALILEYSGNQKNEVCWGAKNSYSCADDRYAKSGLADNFTLAKCFDKDCATDFLLQENYQPKFGGFIKSEIEPPVEPEVPLGNNCLGIKLSEISANNSEQFIEVYNSNSKEKSLKGCAISTNRNDKKYIFDEISLQSGEFLAVNISDTSLLLTKTTSGKVYLLDESLNELDMIFYQNLKTGTSWSKFGEWGGQDWRQTYSITPNSTNQYVEYPACEIGYERNYETGKCVRIKEAQAPSECAEGYYRNPATGRCKKVEVPTVLSECKAGYFRNPETGRCKKIETAAAQTPCKEGYFRNPETGRCKKIQETASLTPCKSGYERNPETNRCRKIVENIGADDPVEEEETETEFSGWLVILGGAVILALMIIWGRREEILDKIKTMKNKKRAKK